MRVIFNEVKCPVCGKVFILPPENVYKIIKRQKRYDFCSYTCFRVAQKADERSKKIKRSY